MATPTLELATALRATADRLHGGVKYQWSHMGSCNCGHLAQTLTKLSPKQIHEKALETRGDWGEQADEFCPSSGLPMDHIIEVMVRAGLTTVDIANLERLQCPDVLAHVPADRRPLDYREREDAILYLRTWADLLERQWRRRIEREQGAREEQPKREGETQPA